ncbi:MAG: helix-turn-helix domain-containing protein [Halobacteriaceae archaeon]
MNPGIRVEVAIPNVAACPLARTSSDRGVTAYSVSKSTDPAVPEHVIEEFSVKLDAEPAPELGEENVTKVFETSEQSIYRFERASHRGCPCECVEMHGFPVVSSRAVDGAVYLVFHTPDQEALRNVVGTLRERYPQVEVRRLVHSRSAGEEGVGSLAFFDRSRLTDRQHEVLQTAHRLGYFRHPKGANAGEVAEALDITTSTFIQHLSAAQQKLLDSILECEPD